VIDLHASLAKIQTQIAAPVAIQSVGNAFTLRNGPVSAGQITLIQADGVAPINAVDLGLTPSAPLPRTLADTQVLFDGEAAALISVASGRVVAVAPYSLAARRQVTIQVVFQGTMSAPYMAEVQADPGYRSADNSGSGQALARNPDGSLNSMQNPAPERSQVTVYLTGIGSVDASCPEGGVAQDGIAPVGSKAVPVPGTVCGLFQQLVQTPQFAGANVGLPNSPLTYAVK
jgi:uncharacterized protein (TIGR03437 family)